MGGLTKNDRLQIYRKNTVNKRRAICHPDRPYYALGLCLSCHNKRRYKGKFAEQAKERARQRRATEDYDEKYHAGNLRRNYGITLEDYDNMLEEQGGVCVICGKGVEENGRRLAVDHNHETGQIRGLLCMNCNMALGQVKDSVERLKMLIDYLEFYEEARGE